MTTNSIVNNNVLDDILYMDCAIKKTNYVPDQFLSRRCITALWKIPQQKYVLMLANNNAATQGVR